MMSRPVSHDSSSSMISEWDDEGASTLEDERNGLTWAFPFSISLFVRSILYDYEYKVKLEAGKYHAMLSCQEALKDFERIDSRSDFVYT